VVSKYRGKKGNINIAILKTKTESKLVTYQQLSLIMRTKQGRISGGSP